MFGCHYSFFHSTKQIYRSFFCYRSTVCTEFGDFGRGFAAKFLMSSLNGVQCWGKHQLNRASNLGRKVNSTTGNNELCCCSFFSVLSTMIYIFLFADRFPVYSNLLSHNRRPCSESFHCFAHIIRSGIIINPRNRTFGCPRRPPLSYNSVICLLNIYMHACMHALRIYTNIQHVIWNLAVEQTWRKKNIYSSVLCASVCVCVWLWLHALVHDRSSSAIACVYTLRDTSVWV